MIKAFVLLVVVAGVLCAPQQHEQAHPAAAADIKPADAFNKNETVAVLPAAHEAKEETHAALKEATTVAPAAPAAAANHPAADAPVAAEPHTTTEAPKPAAN